MDKSKVSRFLAHPVSWMTKSSRFVYQQNWWILHDMVFVRCFFG